MTSVVIIGFGNVGQHLFQAFEEVSGASVVQVYSRKEQLDLDDTPITNSLQDLTEADLYILAVPDDIISDFSEQLPFSNRLVVHTSGSVSMEMLSEENRKGIFYPLQTFSKDHEVNFKEIPICCEAVYEEDLELIMSLGELISDKVVQIDSEKRTRLHLAAVFVNNFTNHLYHLSDSYLKKNDIDFDLLKPLIKETAIKVQTLSPFEAQTGPAKRKDRKTINKHLELMEDREYRKLYRSLTKSISKTHGKKL
ncbi:DUF2520 domain-containing protein [Aureisphaera galaxeae]|uniref:Rossmann-like and DUF2520 domain-containing protein n=1 Tax=Aureisphaera galaxeae TaxID=1538023 RepID=UPI002350D42E|nr:Rossmann-like and DUF2520 domain-containing protein [Aureisphaera galaxeae]MDC8003820.1 DUF2520 domain-containing protein [Aureisphaera galaxeae]